MKISYNWLQLYFTKKLPKPDKVAELLTMHSFEVESYDEVRLRGTAKPDFVFNIDVLPNRAHDCLGHYGIAREITAILSYKILNLKSQIRNKSKITNSKLKIQVDEPELCRRYVGRMIGNVKVGPSPKWMKEKLETIGQKSINNIVDATNFVMFEFGQPLHTFDTDKIDGKITVRKAKKGEKIITLDNQEMKLDEDTLIIADQNDLLAIAGIKGGKKAEITKKTSNIILEAANFDPVNIKKTSQKINLRTESSLRFEAEISSDLAKKAMDRLTGIILDIAGGEIISETDFFPRQANLYKLGIRPRDVSKNLGIEISEKTIIDILNRLGFGIKKIKPMANVLKLAKSLKGTPYKYGASITYDAPKYFDCSSFVSYVFAHSGVQIPRMTIDQYFFGKPVEKENIKPSDVVFFSSGNGKMNFESKEFIRELKIKEGIDHCGIYLGNGEIIHATRKKGKVIIDNLRQSPSFKNLRGIRRFIEEKDDLLLVTVPAERLDILRKEDLIEEVARIYGYEKIPSLLPREILIPPRRNDNFFYAELARDILAGAGFSEVYNYSFTSQGDIEIDNPITDDKKYLRKNLLGGLKNNIDDNLRYFKKVRIFEIGKIFPKTGETISIAGIASDLDFYGIKGVVDVLLAKIGINDFYYKDHPNKTADIRMGNSSLGFIDHNAFEINFEKLRKTAGEEIEYQPLSRYPVVKRDIAIFVPLDTRVVEAQDVIENIAGPILVETELFDIYENGEKKSFAFHLIFQSDKKTLSEREINSLMEKIFKALESNPQWEVRRA